jgi:hypothetical protein
MADVHFFWVPELSYGLSFQLLIATAHLLYHSSALTYSYDRRSVGRSIMLTGQDQGQTALTLKMGQWVPLKRR